jgi:hypothetical protein
MRIGAKVTVALGAAAVAWDLVCPSGEQISAVIGAGLADKRTRGALLLTAVVLGVHLVQQALVVSRSLAVDPPAPLDLERFRVLRNVGWM